MIETLVILLTAHLLGDFVLQTSWMAARNKKSSTLVLKACLVTGTAALLLGNLHASILLILFGSNLASDAVRVSRLPDRFSTFLIEQLVPFPETLINIWQDREFAQCG